MMNEAEMIMGIDPMVGMMLIALIVGFIGVIAAYYTTLEIMEFMDYHE